MKNQTNKKQQQTHIGRGERVEKRGGGMPGGPLKPVSSSSSLPPPMFFSHHIVRDMVKMHSLMYASSRDGLWILHGARALNAYLPIEFQSETVDFDWIVQDTEMEYWEHFLTYLRQKTGADIEIVHTKHANTISLSVQKVRILDIMFINSFGFSLYKEETEIMEVPYSITPNPMAPLILPIPQQMFIRVCSFSYLVRTLQECIHDIMDLGLQNEWRRIRDQKTMRKIMYCQSLGYNPTRPTWIPISMLDCKLGLSQYKHISSPPTLAPPKKTTSQETQTDSETREIDIQTEPEMQNQDADKSVEISVQTEPPESQDQDANKSESVEMSVQTEPIVIMTCRQLETIKVGFLKQLDGMVEKTRLVCEKKIADLQQKVIGLKSKHYRVKKQLVSCCKYLYHGWKTDISFHKMYHEKLKNKFQKYKKSVSLIKLLVMSLLENKSLTFKEWSFMNWAMFQDSFLRHLEWFANEGIPGMVDTQLYIQDIPLWWKDQVNLFPFVSSTVSYAMYNFLNTSHKTRVGNDLFIAMRETSDRSSIYELRSQNSYITKQLTQFTYDVLESKRMGWYSAEFTNLPLVKVEQEYDNSKIKMEALVCLVVSSVLHHQVKNESSDRNILVTLERVLDKFDNEFQIELEDDMYPVLITKGKQHWQRPTPYTLLRRKVINTNNLTDNFLESLPTFAPVSLKKRFRKKDTRRNKKS